jgi:hypothetical protein
MQGPDGPAIQLPPKAPHAMASVVVLEIAGQPRVADVGISQAADATLSLRAIEATVRGRDGPL